MNQLDPKLESRYKVHSAYNPTPKVLARIAGGQPARSISAWTATIQPGNPRMRQPNVLISLGILLILGLHTAPFFRPDLRKQLWPFLDWTMYKDSRDAGPIQTNKRHIVGTTLRGDSQR